MVRRRPVSVVAVLALAGALAACGRTAAKSSTITILDTGDENVLGLPWDVPEKFLVFLPLVAQNAQGELEGRLAESWEHSPDYRTWTIHLRSGVRWHDGAPVTARDIKFTLEFMSRPDVLRLPPDAVSVTVRDDTTYTLTLRKGTAGSPLDSWTVYYPEHLLTRLDPAQWGEWDFWLHPVGNGPYRYVRHVPKTMIELAANPDYYRGRPTIEHVVLQFGSPLVTELLSGNADAVAYFNPIDLPKIAGDPRFATYSYIEPGNVRALIWNTRHPALRDPRVRRAFTLAIDRRELLGVLNLPRTTPIFDVIFSGGQLRRGEVPPPLPHDPAEARRLLAQAGWSEVEEHGIRHRGGQPLRFEALVSPFAGMDRMAVFVQAQLRAVGAWMDIKRILIRRVRAGEFDAVMIPMPISGQWAGIEFFGRGSPSGYVNPRVIALLDRARAAADPAEVDRAYRELAPIFQADLPATFLAPGVFSTVASRRLHGLSTPYRANPVEHMDELWLERAVP